MGSIRYHSNMFLTGTISICIYLRILTVHPPTLIWFNVSSAKSYFLRAIDLLLRQIYGRPGNKAKTCSYLQCGCERLHHTNAGWWICHCRHYNHLPWSYGYPYLAVPRTGCGFTGWQYFGVKFKKTNPYLSSKPNKTLKSKKRFMVHVKGYLGVIKNARRYLMLGRYCIRLQSIWIVGPLDKKIVELAGIGDDW